MDTIIVKKSSCDIKSELESISFDSSYINFALNKYKGQSYKLFGLKPYEANILKQICLSSGFDCAVSKDTVTCKCEKTDALIFGTFAQIDILISKLKNQPFRLKQIAFELEKIINNRLEPYCINNHVFDWSRPYIMGIVNLTPDSFSDGGKYYDLDSAYSHVINLINDGADIIDIGGESTRPGAGAITFEEEISRVLPLVKLLRNNCIDIPISIDTRNYKTAIECINNGANIINDVSYLNDKNMLSFINDNNIPVILMHSDSVPANSSDYFNGDIVEEIYINLYEKLSTISSDKIIIDVGIGFGKSLQSCYELVKRMSEFSTLNKPILSGISRKSFIYKNFNTTPNESDNATALFSSVLAKQGINIHRVHNVKLVKEYFNYINVI